MGADGRVVLEVLGEDLLGGVNVGAQNGLLGLRVGEAFQFGSPSGQLEEGDGVGEVDGGWTAFLEEVQTGLDVGDGLFWGSGGWSGC